MMSHSERRIHEYLRHGGQVFNAQHPQREEVSVYGLSVDRLTKKSCMCRTDLTEKSPSLWLWINTSPHVVRVVLMRLHGVLQQHEPLCVLLGTFTPQSDIFEALNCTFTVKFWWSNSTCFAGSCIACTNLKESTVVARIASVRPYLNMRKDALSYVEQQRLYILKYKNSTHDVWSDVWHPAQCSDYKKASLTWSRRVEELFAQRHPDSAYVALGHFSQNEKTWELSRLSHAPSWGKPKKQELNNTSDIRADSNNENFCMWHTCSYFVWLSQCLSWPRG